MKRLHTITILMLLVGTAAVAQTDAETISFANPFISVPALVTFITLFTEILKKRFNFGGLGLQIFTWGIGLVLSAIGKLLSLGIFGDMQWDAIITTGVMIGVGSNLLYKGGVSKPTGDKLEENV